MSGISLYERLLEYYRSRQQIVQDFFVRRFLVTRQYSTIFSVLRPEEEKECSVTGSAVKGGTDG
jgi:hypothetical protein